MDRELHERTELEIIKFQTEDVITTSGIDSEDDETSRNFLPKLLVIRQYDCVVLTIICYKISAPLNNSIFLEVPIRL